VEVDEALFLEVLRLNLLSGLVTPTRVLARRWIEKGVRGCVVNLTSMTSYKGLSGTWAYDAAKAGVLNLNEALAKELAPHGIRVNAIAPGFFLGHKNRALLIDEQSGRRTARGEAIVARTPFGRFGELTDLHGAVLFLASEKAAGFVTGVSIPVDGGYLADSI
jgi:NAD(P)-dependent dehydrogenase (short-subunit alcohol dehydrogenase family)